MKGGSEIGLAMGVGALCTQMIDKPLSQWKALRSMPAAPQPPMLTIFSEPPFMSSPRHTLPKVYS
jgi:hypothetical protein